MPDINYGAALTDAASYAAGGMVLGPPGAIIGGLVGFASDMVPALLPHLFGKKSSQVYAQVKNTVAAATGGKTDPKDVQAVMSADPAKAEDIKQGLIEIAAKADEAQRQADLQQRQAELEQLKTTLADTANAREQTQALVMAGTPIAWGAPIVSVLVLMMFIATVLVAFWPVQAGHAGATVAQATSPLLNAVLGTLGAMSTAVVTYWVGSSAGSAQKTALLARAQPVA